MTHVPLVSSVCVQGRMSLDQKKRAMVCVPCIGISGHDSRAPRFLCLYTGKDEAGSEEESHGVRAVHWNFWP